MEPYLDFAANVMQDADSQGGPGSDSEVGARKALRFAAASALNWGFADFDDLGVEVDKRALTQEDFTKLMDLLKFRPMQYCIF